MSQLKLQTNKIIARSESW